MANTKVTSRVLADDAVGLAQLNITNDPSDGQALTAADDGTNNYNLTWATVSGSVAGISSSADATAITINSSEQVGIGTSSINARLVVSDSGDSPVRFISSGQATNYLELANTGGSAMVFSNNNDLVFGTSNSPTERMRIDGSGNVGINKTAPAAPLHVKGASGAVTGVIYAQQDTTGVGKPGIALSKYDNDNSTSQVYIMFGINQYNAGCGQINANGASQAAFGSFSDRRLKENISDLPSQLDNIVALEPKEFDYIESEGGGHQIGFVAQDVEEIYPDLVGEREDGMKTLTGIGKMEARLISAIKELKTELDAAKARIETLESN